MHTPTYRSPLHDPQTEAYEVASRHRTSDGTVIYLRCLSCDALRVELESRDGTTTLLTESQHRLDAHRHAFDAVELTPADAEVQIRTPEPCA